MANEFNELAWAAGLPRHLEYVFWLLPTLAAHLLGARS